MDKKQFLLSENFINKYKRKKPPFGFNGLGELVYMRTYSRIKENGKMKDGGKLLNELLRVLIQCKRIGLIHIN